MDTGERKRSRLFSELPRIEGERIVIEPLRDADADALRELVENERAYRFEPSYLYERQFDDMHEAIAQVYGDVFRNRQSLILAVRWKETGELCGLAEFYGLRESAHKISFGCRLLERFWGRGIASEATRLAVDYLYGQTDIELITASSMVGNTASAHVLEKCGFIRTARNVPEDWGFAEPVLTDKWFY